MIAGFYLSYVITDFVFQMIGNAVFSLSEDFTCEGDGTVLLPLTNSAAAFVLAQSLIMLSFSVMVLLVFFRIPDSYKLIAHSRSKNVSSFASNMQSKHSSNPFGDDPHKSLAN